MKKPYFNDMFPNLDPFPPFEADYKAKTKNILIYKYSEINLGDRDYDDCCELCNSFDCYDQECKDKQPSKLPKHQPPYLTKKLEEINLQDIINQIPTDLSPKDIKIECNIFEHNSYTCLNLEFYYSKDFPADLEGYERDKLEYENASKLFEEENKKYREFTKEQKIRELENKLKELKSK